MGLKPIVELGVAEAHALLVRLRGADGVPPLDAVENEDWGRDYLLSRFLELDPAELRALGLRADEDAEKGEEEAGPEDQSG